MRTPLNWGDSFLRAVVPVLALPAEAYVIMRKEILLFHFVALDSFKFIYDAFPEPDIYFPLHFPPLSHNFLSPTSTNYESLANVV